MHCDGEKHGYGDVHCMFVAKDIGPRCVADRPYNGQLRF